MAQVHKRFTKEQVKVLLQGYSQGNLSRQAIEELLGIGKTRFSPSGKPIVRIQRVFPSITSAPPHPAYPKRMRHRSKTSCCARRL
jgi:hypothetical protein